MDDSRPKKTSIAVSPVETSKPAPQVGTCRFRPFDANNNDVQVGAPFGRSHVGSTMNTVSKRSFQTPRARGLHSESRTPINVTTTEKSVENFTSGNAIAGHGCGTKAKPPLTSSLSKPAQKLLSRRPTYRDVTCSPFSKWESHRDAENNLLAVKKNNQGATRIAKFPSIPQSRSTNLRKEGYRFAKNSPTPDENTPCSGYSWLKKAVPVSQATPSCISTNHHSQDTKKRVDVSESSTLKTKTVRAALKDVRRVHRSQGIDPWGLVNDAHTSVGKTTAVMPQVNITPRRSRLGATTTLPDLAPQGRESLYQTSSKCCRVPHLPEKRSEDVPKKRRPLVHCRSPVKLCSKATQTERQRQKEVYGKEANFPVFTKSENPNLPRQIWSKCHVPHPPEKRPVDVAKKRRPLVHCRSPLKLCSKATQMERQRHEEDSGKEANFPVFTKSEKPRSLRQIWSKCCHVPHPPEKRSEDVPKKRRPLVHCRSPVKLCPKATQMAERQRNEEASGKEANFPVFTKSENPSQPDMDGDDANITSKLVRLDPLSLSPCVAEETPPEENSSVVCQALSLEEAELSPPVVVESIEIKEMNRSSLLPAGKDIENTHRVVMDPTRPRSRHTLPKSSSVPARPAACENPSHPDIDGEDARITQLVSSPCVAEKTPPNDEEGGMDCSPQKESIQSPHGDRCQLESIASLCANNAGLSSVVNLETAIPNQQSPMDGFFGDARKCATIPEAEPTRKPSVVCKALFSRPAVVDSKDIRRSSLLPAGKDMGDTRHISLDPTRPKTRRTLARSLSVPARPAFPEEGSVFPNIYDHDDFILELFRRNADASARRNAICGELEKVNEPVKINGRRMSTHDMRMEMSDTAKIVADENGRFRRIRSITTPAAIFRRLSQDKD